MRRVWQRVGPTLTTPPRPLHGRPAPRPPRPPCSRGSPRALRPSTRSSTSSASLPGLPPSAPAPRPPAVTAAVPACAGVSTRSWSSMWPRAAPRTRPRSWKSCAPCRSSWSTATSTRSASLSAPRARIGPCAHTSARPRPAPPVPPLTRGACRFFCEHNMLGLFVRLMDGHMSARVKTQVIQTVSILVQNIQSETTLCAWGLRPACAAAPHPRPAARPSLHSVQQLRQPADRGRPGPGAGGRRRAAGLLHLLP